MNTTKKPMTNPIIYAVGAGLAIGAVSLSAVLHDKPHQSVAEARQPRVLQPITSTTATDMSALHALDDSFAALAEYAEPAVVHIRATDKQPDILGNSMIRGGEGSGVIFRPDGYIITNDHVVGGFDEVTVVLSTGKEYSGKVIRQPKEDIAVVKIDADNLPTLPLGNSDYVKPGQFSMAIGSPFGYANSVTIGHISGLGRSSQIPDSRRGEMRVYPDLLQTDTPINMGNSGGPLINIDGEVIGINTAIASQSGGSNGIGFAIPSNQAKLIANLLIDKGSIQRGFLGIAPDNLKEYQKEEMGIKSGALVVMAEDQYPAAKAGIRKGDVIVRIGDYEIKDQMDLRNTMLYYSPGSKVAVEVIRDGSKKTFNVDVIEPPADLQTLKQRTGPKRVQEVPEDFFRDMPGMEDFRDFFKNPKTHEMPQMNSDKPTLGVTIEALNQDTRKQFEVPESVNGVVVTRVMPHSLAASVGLEPGDVILEFDGEPVTSVEGLASAVKNADTDKQLSLKFGRYKDGQTLTKSVFLNF